MKAITEFSKQIEWRGILLAIFVTFLIPMSIETYAQGDAKRKDFDREAFEARQNAYITAQVGLTPDEASVFIPLCNELRQKKFAIGREDRRFSREMRSKKNPSDSDYLKAVDGMLDNRIQEAQLEKEYYEKFKKILSPEKLFKYQMAESQFARSYVRKNMRDNNGKDR